MGPTQTTRCQTCQAIVNPSWESCAACRSPLTSSEIVIEPAATNPRPVYWECGTGEILGPAQPEFLARVGNGPRETYWVVALFDGLPVWINATALRSKQAFETQVKPKPFERIEEPW
jgi:hypothetical protein